MVNNVILLTVVKSFRKFHLKNIILKAVQNGQQTSAELLLTTGHDNKRYLRSETSMLRRRGYLRRSGTKAPFTWHLTKKGELHVADPYLGKRKKQDYFNARLDETLMSNEKFSMEVERLAAKMAQQMATHTTQVIKEGGADPFVNAGDLVDDEVPNIVSPETPTPAVDLEAYEKMKEELNALKFENMVLKNQAMPNAKPKNPVNKTEFQINKEKRIQGRKDLARRYNGHNLDYEFFRRWQDNYPYRMKKFGLFKKGSVEILSKSNREHTRGHVGEILDSYQIIDGGFYINDMRKNGIYVIGKGMAERKLMTW